MFDVSKLKKLVGIKDDVDLTGSAPRSFMDGMSFNGEIPLIRSISTNRAAPVNGEYKELYQDVKMTKPENACGLHWPRKCNCWGERHPEKYSVSTMTTATPIDKPTVLTEPKAIRFIRPDTHDDSLSKYFQVIFKGKLTEFKLVDSMVGDFITVDRFVNARDLNTVHRIVVSPDETIHIEVDASGGIVKALSYGPDGLSSDVDTFEVPVSNSFLQYVSIKTTISGLI